MGEEFVSFFSQPFIWQCGLLVLDVRRKIEQKEICLP
jgi:hypothetical protein